jgi:hypothetical protein
VKTKGRLLREPFFFDMVQKPKIAFFLILDLLIEKREEGIREIKRPGEVGNDAKNGFWFSAPYQIYAYRRKSFSFSSGSFKVSLELEEASWRSCL